jgi:anti-sigma28 factor (negative regulator of flagellin synthesis)
LKISDRNTITPIRPIKERLERARVESGDAKQGDKVSLSAEALELKQLEAARIAELTRAIAEGEYQVDLELLAEAFVSKEILQSGGAGGGK